MKLIIKKIIFFFDNIILNKKIKILFIFVFINLIKEGIFSELIKIIYLNSRDKVKKVCLFTPSKYENLYIREFIEYYIKYGVDKIFIYDNNDINGEIIENIILNYIKNGSVEVINYRGKEKAQLELMNDCYKKIIIDLIGCSFLI